MTVATDFQRLFAEGWANYLAAAGLGWTFADTYAPGDKAIWRGKFPTGPTFDASTALALAVYPLADDPNYADSTVGLRLSFRAPGQDPNTVMGLDDAAANVLLGNFPLDLPGGVHITTITRVPIGSLGFDEAKNRWTWASSYPCRVLRPGLHRS